MTSDIYTTLLTKHYHNYMLKGFNIVFAINVTRSLALPTVRAQKAGSKGGLTGSNKGC